jgi:hypothetical protein
MNRAFAAPSCGWPRFVLYAVLCCATCIVLR